MNREPTQKKEDALLQSAADIMTAGYYRIACIDLQNNSIQNIKIDDPEDQGGFCGDYREYIKKFAQSHVLEAFRTRFLNVMEPEKMEELFDSGLHYVDLNYQRLERGTACWVNTELIPVTGYGPDNRRVMWWVRNVAEKKEKEEKQKTEFQRVNAEMNLRMETILNGIAGGFKISREDPEFTYYYLGESTAALFGYTREEFMRETGGSALGAVWKEDRETVLREMREQLSAGDAFSVKYRIRCRDGSFRRIEDSGKRVINENGESLLYSLYHDVTELETKNDELQDALTLQQNLVASFSTGIFAYRLPSREILVFNHEARRLFGWDGEDLPSAAEATWMTTETVFEEDFPAMRRAVAKLKKPGDVAVYSYRIRRDNGEILHVRVTSRLLEFADGSRFILSAMQDVTEEIRLTDSIRDERKQYRDALTANCVFAFSLDLSEGVLQERDLAEQGENLFELLGFRNCVYYDDLIARWREIRQPRFINEEMGRSLTRAELLERFSEGETNVEAEFYTAATGRFTRAACLLSRNDRNGHVMACVVGKDTTENRKKEEQTRQALEEAYEAAKRANSAKSDFLSRMSHDIRTPMNAIMGMTSIAQMHLKEPKKLEDCLGKIESASRHLLSLVNAILDMSKIESGKMELNEMPFCLTEMIETLDDMTRPQAEARNQQLKIHPTELRHTKVVGDELRIQRTFVNILGNAVKYTQEGGQIDLYISEKPSSLKGMGNYEFVFADNGIGMDEEMLEHLFEPFSRTEDSRISKTEGSGLGLAIAHNLIQMMGGDIRVESTPGAGTVFTVWMPLKLQEESGETGEKPEMEPKKKTEELEEPHFAGERILLAEDNDLNAEITIEILEMMGLEVERAADGQEALERFANSSEGYYCLIFMDIQMPRMNGNEAARAIRALARPDARTIPVIAMTANAFADDIRASVEAGMNEHISKPLNIERLAGTLQKWLNEKDRVRK